MSPRAPAPVATPPAPGLGRALAQQALVLGLSAGLAGCIVVPRTADVYSERCQTTVRQVVLEAEVIGTLGACRNDGCVVMLASMGIISAASAVVSGSVAIIGNIAHWVERGGECPRPPPPLAAAGGMAAGPAGAVGGTGTGPVAPAPAPAAAAASAPLPRPPIVPGIQPMPPARPATSVFTSPAPP